METSTFDLYLFITKDRNSFGVVGMQTDDILILGDETFVRREDEELRKAKLLAKPTESLTVGTPLLFNGCELIYNDVGDGITLA